MGCFLPHPKANDRGPQAPSADANGLVGEAGHLRRRAGPGRSPRNGGRPRREGIVVPLRPPARNRLRAVTGLFLLVVVLGTVTAALVVAVALAGASALGNL